MGMVEIFFICVRYFLRYKNALIEITTQCSFSNVIGITENTKIGSSQKYNQTYIKISTQPVFCSLIVTLIFFSFFFSVYMLA